MKGYGYSLNDPIRVSGFYEEKCYIESLRETRRNTLIRFVRLGSGRSEATGHPVDVYEARIKRGLFPKKIWLYVDIYGDTDWRAPEGLCLCAPAPKRGEGGGTEEDAETLFAAIQRVQKLLNQ